MRRNNHLNAAVALAIILLAGCAGTTKPAAATNSQGTTTAAPASSAGPGAGIQYYVSTTGSDSNNGSSASPWRTIAHAALMVVPGAQVNVLPGVYNESVFFDISGTATQRIRFVSSTQWGALVTGDGSGNPAFQIRNANYMDIVGFEVTNINGYIGIETLASYSNITGNLVHNVSGGCALGNFSLGGAGINLALPGHDATVANNIVHDIGNYLNPHGCESTHGIYVENARSPDPQGYSTRAWNNIIYRNEADGITSWHCATEMILANNDSFENGRAGISVGASDSGCINDHSIVNNNILVHNGYHDYCTYTDPQQCPIGNHSGKGAIYEVGTTGPNNLYITNLTYQNQYDGSQDDTIHLLTGSQISTLVGLNPQFVNYQADGSGNYHLQSTSPAINAGTSMDAPTFDFDNFPRPYNGNWDVGAYQWHP